MSDLYRDDPIEIKQALHEKGMQTLSRISVASQQSFLRESASGGNKDQQNPDNVAELFDKFADFSFYSYMSDREDDGNEFEELDVIKPGNQSAKSSALINAGGYVKTPVGGQPKTQALISHGGDREEDEIIVKMNFKICIYIYRLMI